MTTPTNRIVVSGPEEQAAEVVGKLTAAQKRAIVSAEEREARGVWNPAGVYASADRRVRYNLALLDLTTDYLRSGNRLTPLGLAVRAHLLAEQGQ